MIVGKEEMIKCTQEKILIEELRKIMKNYLCTLQLFIV
ncbi:hypothetical protein C8N26_2656 [Tenacibaculum lutimaris]|uniref:Uncharacterized protein n=1 Tax=Tenacibaculum lutimaris TaxID=285258 RepID=A0A420DYB5_9FLAO|nr:hypothetical protein C8N26_2656 [Tenacibaculum lutimaris]